MRFDVDSVSARFQEMLDRVLTVAHPDMLRWFNKLGQYSPWQAQLDKLDDAIRTGNARLIDTAFGVTEAELNRYVSFFNKYCIWLEDLFTRPHDLDVPLEAIPESLLHKVPDKLLVAAMKMPPLPETKKVEPIKEFQQKELLGAVAQMNADGWGEDIPLFLLPREVPTLQPEWFTRKR